MVVEDDGTEAINADRIAEFMKQYELSPNLFFKTSSLTGENVSSVFAKLSELFCELLLPYGRSFCPHGLLSRPYEG